MIKKERGAITLFTVVICMFLLVNVLLINVGVMNRNASQEKEIAKISENYEVSQAKMEQAYQEVLESNEYPTYGDLLKLLEQMKEEAKTEAKEETRNEVENLVKQAKTDTKNEMYPIGSIYISTKETSPSDFIGGTWERYGKGKTLIGLDESQTEFDTVNETGGQKNITLKVSQLPSHNHSIPILTGTTSQSGAHTHSYDKANTSTNGTAISVEQMPKHTHTQNAHSHTAIGNFYGHTTWPNQTFPTGYLFKWSHDYLANASLTGGSGPWASVAMGSTSSNAAVNQDTGGGQEHAHKIGFTQPNTGSSGLHTHELTTQASTTGNAGNTTPDSINVQDPYITVYMWQRIS